MSSPTIFISYRRDDTRWAAAMIYHALEWAFGRNSVFFDRSTIVPGMEWPEKICTAVEQSRVVLAVIGKSWLTAADGAGQARLFQNEDWVRHEIRTALQRADGPLVIPVFVDDAKPPRTDQLPPDLAALPLRQGRSVREVPDFDADIAAVVGQIAGRLGVQPQPFASFEREKMVADYYATKDGGNRQRMIAKVRAAWIRGVLDKALSKADGFTLGLDYAPTAVVQPRGSSAVALLDSRNIAEVFEEFDHRLLILGTPGSGKTILLLQLARRLLDDADREINAPIPVVLNLSSWAARRLPLHEWLVQDLRSVYQVPAKIARDWIERQQLLLLLDGLDEVTAEHRAMCVEKINAHVESWPTQPIAVCSRLRDYEEIGVLLKLYAAVRLEPLELARAQELIAGPEYTGLRTVAENEPALREMLTVPFLLNLIRVAYLGESADRLALPNADDPAKARRADVFETYIEGRLNDADANTAHRKPQFYRRLVRRWLSWLAASMQQRGESIFYVEALQGSWLPMPVQRMAFVITSSLVFGALVGSIGGLGATTGLAAFIGEPITVELLIDASIIVGVIGALIVVHGALGQMTAQPLLADWGSGTTSRVRPLLACAKIVLVTLLGLSLPFFALLKSQKDWPLMHSTAIWLVASVVGVIYFSFLMFAFRGLHRLCGRFRWWRAWMVGPALGVIVVTTIFVCKAFADDEARKFLSAKNLTYGVSLVAALALGSAIGSEIRMVEQLTWRWSWRGTLLGAVAGIAFGCWFGLTPNASLGPGASLEPRVELLIYGVIFALLGAPLGGVWGGVLKSDRLTERQSPGAGLTRTLRNAAVVNAGFLLTGGLFFSGPILVGCALGASISHPVEALLSKAGAGASLGVIFGLFLGGTDALIKHWLLRFQLRASGCLPLRLIGLLEHAASCLFLRRVGGGYIFLHRYLLEHFADRCPADLARKGASAGEVAGRTI